jgi:predicted RNA binding protein YcfA (HicA-like mRNA interferase family)
MKKGLKRVYNTHVNNAIIIKRLRADGWYVFSLRGSHHQFKHPLKQGKVTVPHPKADLPVGTVKSIFKQAGMELEG